MGLVEDVMLCLVAWYFKASHSAWLLRKYGKRDRVKSFDGLIST